MDSYPLTIQSVYTHVTNGYMDIITLVVLLKNSLVVCLGVIMPDYKLRGELYDNGYIQRYKRLSFESRYYSFHGYTIAADERSLTLQLLMESDSESYNEARKAVASDYRRNTRLRSRIKKMMSKGKCTFLTLTFTDDVLQSTSTATRRQYVIRFLKSQSQEYIANIDFGAINHREHYHACLLGRIDPHAWKFGNVDCKSIVQSSDPHILALYIGKLCMHAVKETTKRNAIIYSRA